MEQVRQNWFAIVGVTLGVSGLILIVPLSLFAVALALLGVISSSVALWRIKRGIYADGRGISVAGLVCGCIAVVVMVAVVISTL